MSELSQSNTIVERFDKIIFGLLMMFLLCSSFSIALTQIGYFGALILWIIKMLYARKNEFPQTELDYFFFAFIIAETIAATFSYNKPVAFLYLQRRVLLLPIIYTIVGNVKSVKDLQYLFIALMVSALGVSLWQTKDLLLHLGEFLHFQRRLGEFQIYMTAGGIMMIAGLLLLPILLHPETPKKIRWWTGLALIPILTNLFFTFTRSSWLGFVAGVIVIGFVRTKKLLLILLAALVIIIVVSPPEVQGRIFSIVDPNHYANQTRINMWHVGWKMFLDNPLIGIGDIGTEVLWYRYSDLNWGPEGHLHNNLFHWLATLGLLGFTIVIALFVKLWLTIAKIEKRQRTDWFFGSIPLGALAVYAGFHINGLFEWNFGDAEIIMLVWAITGMALASRKLTPIQRATV
ncbi:MAG: O-antigen ligase family protein [Bacteroidetes bacterium]|nr:MAG: O-antigen ligase family protein [Bacteroidota bacterium]